MEPPCLVTPDYTVGTLVGLHAAALHPEIAEVRTCIGTWQTLSGTFLPPWVV